MNVMPMDRRMASELARALDQGTRPAEPKLAALVGVVDRLRPLAEGGPAPSQEFRETLRARLLATAAEAVADISPAPPRTAPVVVATPWRRRFVAAGAGATLAAGAMGGVAVASNSALPGDTLYGVKRTVEDVRLSLARGDEGKGRQYLGLASTRLGEVERLLRENRTQPTPAHTVDRVGSTLGDMEAATGRGSTLLTGEYRRTGNARPLQVLRGFSERQRTRLEAIQPMLPAQLLARQQALLAQLRQIEAQLGQLTGHASTPGRGAATPGSGTGSGTRATSPPSTRSQAKPTKNGAPASVLPHTPAPSGSPTARTPAPADTLLPLPLPLPVPGPLSGADPADAPPPPPLLEEPPADQDGLNLEVPLPGLDGLGDGVDLGG